jgi:hypothetical protein
MYINVPITRTFVALKADDIECRGVVASLGPKVKAAPAAIARIEQSRADEQRFGLWG